ncbi:cysteine sulfinic acid decarboxylase, isoform CRA_c [Homo sapiens]|uniref:Cysteine sulfinic acid decarboxylase n=1 Tax=Homo sapiens TaxID=9606 RepID=F6XLJ2_HUMAN|nr:cysteine sulfinic acid decarboxylase-related protein 1 [Homo sapiens]EAW96669.1 cysteine sulfinic acid decarboxylase, isoform CRA_c [Homo sapiens]EAW96672.1 cysteine sulfinic acid decarboxylase, isoform CRA_c [Homo sapiens]KAI2565910.1 cysteine sulfinic acid decarboxylase [Homo sapiens]KAI2565911.1 cysteine sulfinic acid decarboxylase [Homo sapiens]
MADSEALPSLAGDPVAVEALLRAVFGVVVDEAIQKGTSVSQKVCEWKEPEELKQLLDLELRSQGESQKQILERCRAVIRYSVKTGHPRFFNQLFSGLDPHALAGRIITESLNTSQYTYEIAPVFVLMEEEVLRKLRALVGWSSGDGIFCPGGSISNMYAVNLARYQRYPDCKQRGLRTLPPLALFTSKEVGKRHRPNPGLLILISSHVTTPSRRELRFWDLAPTVSEWSRLMREGKWSPRIWRGRLVWPRLRVLCRSWSVPPLAPLC